MQHGEAIDSVQLWPSSLPGEAQYYMMLVVTRLYSLIGNYEQRGLYWLGPLGRAVPKGGVFPDNPSSSETQKWDVDAFHPPASGKWFEQFAPQGNDVIGFNGRSGGLLDAIGIVYPRI